ncbi:FAD-dependent pyridine nucleotide-disulfide oxidoreductase [Penicillium cf. griseofulvum]|uniref:FAD-dependent pyridine nucleotide-disulfide oxidoreductase n=1 Tax=Penicillium cf. griseofulvum TaxID=2972120 RepID=A0A9W9MFG4_9EURO|nr:FAD-dependent pyridine nucleotide-disulfide oxidoreductase [Penicillium cf. griseofulvum]KAJ5423816.1 FAD-dependent pyridine nucleotide-disulfide oxidoreductase [Penicillium cf. griseofulvum]KAJ5430931.1 FAD-dependent pyridine nucleotide-disulfide oxidoreductase [Penicillium cf. griseofulvum]
MATRKCAAVVVGAGPAGVAVMGNLLERQLGTIAWVDPSFEGGRVHCKYREVPSNTKVALFQAFAKATQPFQKVIDNTKSPNAFTKLAKLDQESTCTLGHAADMVRALTDGLLKMEEVYACHGFVKSANLNETTSNWTISIKQNSSEDLETIEATRLILCTGSFPTTVPIPVAGLNIQRLDLDLVLKPSDLANTLPADRPISVAIVGASHSAILAILNLTKLAQTSHPLLRISWFTRHPLRYAEYKDGWILRDNTGLKGLAANFARAELEDDKLATSPAGQVLAKIDCAGGQEIESAQYQKYLPSCDYLVQAVGYSRAPLPTLTKNGVPLLMSFDHDTGAFHEPGSASDIPGLSGAGIAFPERVVDPHGNEEYAVGFWKFMKFLKRVVPSWVA